MCCYTYTWYRLCQKTRLPWFVPYIYGNCRTAAACDSAGFRQPVYMEFLHMKANWVWVNTHGDETQSQGHVVGLAHWTSKLFQKAELQKKKGERLCQVYIYIAYWSWEKLHYHPYENGIPAPRMGGMVKRESGLPSHSLALGCTTNKLNNFNYTKS